MLMQLFWSVIVVTVAAAWRAADETETTALAHVVQEKNGAKMPIDSLH